MKVVRVHVVIQTYSSHHLLVKIISVSQGLHTQDMEIRNHTLSGMVGTAAPAAHVAHYIILHTSLEPSTCQLRMTLSSECVVIAL